jgi:predicted MFS family arabinose efflux permease
VPRSTAQIKLLLGSFAGLATGYSVFAGVAFTMFIEPLSSAFGWSRTAISGALTVCSASLVLGSPFAGALLDRYGVRRLLIPSIVVFGLAVGALSTLQGNLVHFYLIALAIALSGIATLPATYSRMLVASFTGRRGLALSIALSGVGVAAVVLPVALERIIADFGWRTAYLSLAAIILVVGWPIVTLWLREVPGSTDVGRATEAQRERSVATAPDRDRRRRLLHQTPLARMIVACFVLGLSMFGVIAHLMPLLTAAMGSTREAAAAVSLLGASTFASRLLCGWLLDRVFAPFLAGFVFLVAAASLIYVAAADAALGILVAVILLGLANGADFDIISYLLSRYVPLKHYTWAYGLVYSAFLAGATLGPLLLGFAYDRSGGYSAGVLTFAAGILVSGALFATLGPYREPLHVARDRPADAEAARSPLKTSPEK